LITCILIESCNIVPYYTIHCKPKEIKKKQETDINLDIIPVGAQINIEHRYKNNTFVEMNANTKFTFDTGEGLGFGPSRSKFIFASHANLAFNTGYVHFISPRYTLTYLIGNSFNYSKINTRYYYGELLNEKDIINLFMIGIGQSFKTQQGSIGLYLGYNKFIPILTRYKYRDGIENINKVIILNALNYFFEIKRKSISYFSTGYIGMPSKTQKWHTINLGINVPLNIKKK
jgi:hypothetical protein